MSDCSVVAFSSPFRSAAHVSRTLLHHRSLKPCKHTLDRLSPSWKSSLIFSGIRSSDITWEIGNLESVQLTSLLYIQADGSYFGKTGIKSRALTSVRVWSVFSLGFRRRSASSVISNALRLRCSTKEDCCCRRTLNSNLWNTERTSSWWAHLLHSIWKCILQITKVKITNLLLMSLIGNFFFSISCSSKK